MEQLRKQQQNNKMVDLSPNIQIITLNIYNLKILIKQCQLIKWIKKHYPPIWCPYFKYLIWT